MRRGTIIVLGSAGPRCGLEMVAGTIAAAVADGTDLGFGMRRGTLWILHGSSESPLPSGTACFAPPTAAPAGFLRLLLADIQPELTSGGIDLSDRSATSWRRSIGDLATGGLGEVIW